MCGKFQLGVLVLWPKMQRGEIKKIKKNKEKKQRNSNKILLTCILGLAGVIFFKFSMYLVGISEENLIAFG